MPRKRRVDTERLWDLDDDQLLEELRFMLQDEYEEVTKVMPMDVCLRLAGFDPADKAEHQQRAWADYLDSVPMLVCVVKGDHRRLGEPIEVAPCVRIIALDTLSECGLGDSAGASDTLLLLRAALESELRGVLGATLGQVRYRCRKKPCAEGDTDAGPGPAPDLGREPVPAVAFGKASLIS